MGVRDASESIVARARWLMGESPLVNDVAKCFAPGWVGFSDVRRGEKVLLATSSLEDPAVTHALADALREKDAIVDLVVVDAGPDRVIEETDEIDAMIRREDWTDNLVYVPRRYNDVPWVTDLMIRNQYDLYVQGRAYPSFTSCRWEGYPWSQAEQFLSDANVFPRELHQLINDKAWKVIWEGGKGARVHVTDPEGTDVSWTLFSDYWNIQDEEVGWFGEKAMVNHLMYHPAPPLVEQADAAGVVAGTLAHFSCPFPRIEVQVRNGRVERVEGGGRYGDGWRALLEETRDFQYEQFPGPGLFWFWEAAVGTNPKIQRSTKSRLVSTGGWEWERWRAGIMHLGFGTAGPSRCELQAGRDGLPYGHLHVHLQFPTIELVKPDGTTERTVDHGHLLALDDPEVRELAARYGDPDDVLRETWVPPVPGISIEGEYEPYAKDPVGWLTSAGLLEETSDA